MSRYQQEDVFAGRYRLVRHLGTGGFSEVWLAQDQMAERAEMVVKIFAPERGLDEQGIRLFRKEYALTVPLHHPHLLKATHYDVFEGSPYLILPYCAGGSLMKPIIAGERFSEDAVRLVMTQMAEALAYLHKEGVVHQDVKPDNILTRSEGRYLLSDFGISSRMRRTIARTVRRTAVQGASAFTPGYASPERHTSKPAPAWDIFALGVTLYELATGDLPFDDPALALQKGATIPDLPASFSPALSALLRRCMALDPSERPTAAELRAPAVNKVKKPFPLVKGAVAALAIVAALMLWQLWPDTPEPVEPAIPAAYSAALARGDLLQVARDFEGALAAFEEALAVVPNDETATLRIEAARTKAYDFYLARGRSLAAAGEYNEAMVQYDSAMVYRPGDAVAQEAREEAQEAREEAQQTVANELLINKPSRIEPIEVDPDKVPQIVIDTPPANQGTSDTDIMSYLQQNYDQYSIFPQEGLYRVQKNGKWGFIDAVSRQEVVSLRYDELDLFWDGLVKMKLGDRYGFLDKSGREVIPPQFRGATNFGDGLAGVENDQMQWGYINRQGELVIPYQFGIGFTFADGRAPVAKSIYDKYGFIDTSGNLVIPYRFDWANSFSEGRAYVSENGRAIYIDTAGRCVDQCN